VAVGVLGVVFAVKNHAVRVEARTCCEISPRRAPRQVDFYCAARPLLSKCKREEAPTVVLNLVVLHSEHAPAVGLSFIRRVRYS
jgi:hypothetical protein